MEESQDFLVVSGKEIKELKEIIKVKLDQYPFFYQQKDIQIQQLEKEKISITTLNGKLHQSLTEYKVIFELSNRFFKEKDNQIQQLEKERKSLTTLNAKFNQNLAEQKAISEGQNNKILKLIKTIDDKDRDLLIFIKEQEIQRVTNQKLKDELEKITEQLGKITEKQNEHKELDEEQEELQQKAKVFSTFIEIELSTQSCNILKNFFLSRDNRIAELEDTIRKYESVESKDNIQIIKLDKQTLNQVQVSEQIAVLQEQNSSLIKENTSIIQLQELYLQHQRIKKHYWSNHLSQKYKNYRRRSIVNTINYFLKYVQNKKVTHKNRN